MSGVLDYAKVMNQLNNLWKPHEGQIPIGKAIFNDGKKRVFVQCGRKFGKSEIAFYCLLRWAVTKSNQECYFIGPKKKQTRRIAWKRLKRFVKKLPPEYILKISESDLEIHFTNGSTIYVDGSDDPESDRGFEVDFLVYEEFKDFKPEYHIGMEPNLAIVDAPLLIIGTPPDHECQYTEIAEECRENRSGQDFWISLASEKNPHVSKKFLDRKKKQLEERGELDVWLREYMGQYVKGGSGAIFPMLMEDKHVMDHDLLYRTYIRRDINKLEWYCFTDPGTTTAFAGLIVAYNPYTKHLYALDEVYETQTINTSVSIVWPKIEKSMLNLNPHVLPIGDEWYRGYDEAAAWFMNEMYDQFQVSFSPTRKKDTNKENGISLIKDILLQGKLTISTRCVHLFKEMEGYIKDKNGKIPKKDDHLIDCLRYILQAIGYSISAVKESVEEKSVKRAYRFHDDPYLIEDF